jgi:hypothetical protein
MNDSNISSWTTDMDLKNKRNYIIEQKINHALTPLLNYNNDKQYGYSMISEESQVHPTRDILNMEMSLHLPSIVKSVENPIEITHDEYKDNLRPPNSINTAGSLRSLSNTRNEQTKASKSKSQIPRRKSKLVKHKQDFITLDSEDACLSKYIQRIYKKQKWSFVKFEKSSKNKSINYTKSQTRKPTISYLPPEHREIIKRWSQGGVYVSLILFMNIGFKLQ